MNKPTKIIAEPTSRIVVTGRGRKVWVSLYLCDDGREYTVSELASAFGLSQATVRHRLESRHWSNPHIFAPPAKHGYGIDGQPVNTCSDGNPEWEGMSNKVRVDNLARVTQPGTFER